MKDWKMQGKPALLILHMQQAILPKGSQRHKLVLESGMLLRQQDLLKAFRERNLPVIFVNSIMRPPETHNLPVYGTLWEETASGKAAPSDTSLIPELTRLPEEPLLINWSMTAFNNSGLEHVLKMYQAETLVLAGFTTNVAIYGTLLGGADRFYNVILPEDASVSGSPEAHKIVMEVMAPRLALVTTADDVIKHLG